MHAQDIVPFRVWCSELAQQQILLLLAVGFLFCPLEACNNNHHEKGKMMFANAFVIVSRTADSPERQIAISDPATIAELTSFFPGLGRDEDEDPEIALKGDVFVTFARPDGREIEVAANTSEEAWRHVSGYGNKWWKIKPGLQAFLATLPSTTSRGAKISK